MIQHIWIGEMALYTVTGGYGFIGRTLVSHLRSQGHEVIIASRARHHLHQDDDWVEFDYNDRSTIHNVMNTKPDGIFHLAWSTTPSTAEADPSSDISTNLVGTVYLLEQMKKLPGVPLILVSSGGAIYGSTDVSPIPETHPMKPISVYGMTKMAMETYALECQQMTDLDVRIARIGNPFGVQQAQAKAQGAATIFARKIIRGEKIDIWGDGSAVRDYVDVEDVASGLSAIMQFSPESIDLHPVFNIGSGQGLSLLDLIDRLSTAAGVKANIAFHEGRGFDIPTNVLDVGKLSRASGWAPRDVNDRLNLLIERLVNGHNA